MIENRIFKKNESFGYNPSFGCIVTTVIKECNFFIKRLEKKWMSHCFFVGPTKQIYFFYNLEF